MTICHRLAGVLLCLGSLAGGCVSGVSHLSQATSAVVTREEPFPTPVVELRGTPVQLGEEHGARLAEPIRILHDRYLDVLLENPAEHFLAVAAASAFSPRLLPEHREEVNALAKQAGISPGDAMLAQCFLDLSDMTACSTATLPASAAPDHIARFARNLDFPSLNVADKYTTLFDYRPEGRYRFVSIGWPGLIGVLSGMNEFGLTLANMEVSRSPRFPAAMPYTLLYRMLLERCRTVDEAIALLRATPRQTANNLMLMDAAGDRAVAEISPEDVVVRRGMPDAALFSTNHRRGQDADTAGRCPRYDFLHDASKREFGQIDVPALEKMLAGASQGDFTLKSMVFEPSTRVLYLATGKNAARAKFYRIELFQGK